MVADETTAVLVLKQLIQTEVPFFLMVLLLVFQILEWPSPVRKSVGPMKAPSINSVATDPALQYAVALSDQNMVIVWKRVETGGSS